MLNQYEKRGRLPHPEWLRKGFQEAVANCGLLDFSFTAHQYTWVRSRGTTTVVEEKLDKILITDYLKELRLLWLRAHIVIICQSYLHQWWLCNTLIVNGSVLITYGFVKMFVVKLLSKAGLLLWGWAFMRGWRCVARIFGGLEVLLKNVLQAMPCYAMMVFLLPIGLCNEIETILNKYWWTGMVGNGWDVECVKDVFNGQDANAILNIPACVFA
nr:uncharacterized protein LOC109158536 [Ipomoea batatas]